MRTWDIMLACFFVSLAASCSPAADGVPSNAAAATPAPAPPAGESAALVPVSNDGDDPRIDSAIAIPRISGVAPAVAERINAVLDRRRSAAIADRAECLGIVRSDRGIAYEISTEAKYNADGLLSLRLSGLIFCDGASPGIVYEMMTFDLRTGAEVDVVAASGLSPAALGEMAWPYYRNVPGCIEALRDRGDGTPALPMGAYLDRGGLAILYEVTSGATKGCSDEAAIIPMEVVRSRLALAPPLDRWVAAAAR